MLKQSLFAITLLAISTSIFGQTKAIAFKSHSGNPAHYSLSGNENFGNICPAPRLTFPSLDSIIKINDTTVVKFYNFQDGNYATDTFSNHPFWCDPNLNIDSLKANDHNNVKFIDFESSHQRIPNGNCAKPKDIKRRNSIKALNMKCPKPTEN